MRANIVRAKRHETDNYLYLDRNYHDGRGQASEREDCALVADNLNHKAPFRNERGFFFAL